MKLCKIFDKFFTKKLLNWLQNKLTQKKQNAIKTVNQYTKWTSGTTEELKAFIGVLIVMTLM